MPGTPVLLVLLAGLGLALQAPTNAALARASGSVWLASLVSFAVGTAALALIWAAGDRTGAAAARHAPGWAWVGGLYGVGFVAAMAYAAPRLGVASALTIAVASQVLAALVLDRFGLLGLPVRPVGAARLLGAALVVGGAVLVRRG